MKKLAITVITLFFSISAFSQTLRIDKIADTSEKGTLEITNAKKVLLIIEYQSERINLGSLAGNSLLAEVDLNLVQRFHVLKGESAIAKFGNDAQNGVIILQMKKSKAAKAMFEDFKKKLSDGLLIDVASQSNIDERTGFGIDSEIEGYTRMSNERAKLTELRPISYAPGVIYIMSLNGKERFLKSSLDLDDLDKQSMESITVLKSAEAKEKYNSKEKDIILITFKSNKETKKFFRKLKKIKNK